MIDITDIKVGVVAFTGIAHHWLLDLDAVLSVLVTLGSLVYIVLKVIEQFNKGK